MGYEIKSRHDLEVVGHMISSRMAIPDNLRLLVIMDPRDFEHTVNEMVAPWAEKDGDQDRFIYTSASGVEFGVKRKDYGENNDN